MCKGWRNKANNNISRTAYLSCIVKFYIVRNCRECLDLPQVYFVKNKTNNGKGKRKAMFDKSAPSFIVSGRLIKDDEIDLGQVQRMLKCPSENKFA